MFTNPPTGSGRVFFYSFLLLFATAVGCKKLAKPKFSNINPVLEPGVSVPNQTDSTVPKNFPRLVSLFIGFRDRGLIVQETAGVTRCFIGQTELPRYAIGSPEAFAQLGTRYPAGINRQRFLERMNAEVAEALGELKKILGGGVLYSCNPWQMTFLIEAMHVRSCAQVGGSFDQNQACVLPGQVNTAISSPVPPKLSLQPSPAMPTPLSPKFGLSLNNPVPTAVAPSSFTPVPTSFFYSLSEIPGVKINISPTLMAKRVGPGGETSLTVVRSDSHDPLTESQKESLTRALATLKERSPNAYLLALAKKETFARFLAAVPSPRATITDQEKWIDSISAAVHEIAHTHVFVTDRDFIGFPVIAEKEKFLIFPRFTDMALPKFNEFNASLKPLISQEFYDFYFTGVMGGQSFEVLLNELNAYAIQTEVELALSETFSFPSAHKAVPLEMLVALQHYFEKLPVLKWQTLLQASPFKNSLRALLDLTLKAQETVCQNARIPKTSDYPGQLRDLDLRFLARAVPPLSATPCLTAAGTTI